MEVWIKQIEVSFGSKEFLVTPGQMQPAAPVF